MDSRFLENKSHFFYLAILTLLGVGLLIGGGGAMSLTHPDEVFYIQTAKEMIRTHHFLTPILFGEPQFEKPILSYWLFIAAIKTMGLNPFAARFFPGLFGLLGVLTIYLLAWAMFKKKEVAFYGAFILLTNAFYIALSRAVLTDMIFSVLVLMAIAFFYWGLHEQKYFPLGMILGFVFTGLAVLAKGALGIVFPWGTVLVYLLITKKTEDVSLAAIVWGLIIFCLITLPWHVYMFKHHGMAFVSEYWNNDHIRRILEAEHERSDRWYFYPALMFAGVMPWSLFWSVTLAGIKQEWQKAKRLSDPMVFILSWIFTVFVTLQVAHSKLASYVVPLLPAIGLLLGYYLNLGLTSPKSFLSKLTRISGVITGIFFCVVSLVGGFMVQRHAHYIENFTPVYVLIIFLFTAGLLIFVFSWRWEFGKMMMALPLVPMTILAVMFLGRAMAEPWVSCKQISDELNRIDQSHSTVLASKFYLRGVYYYTDRPMAVIDINGEGFFSSHPIPFLNTDAMVLNFLESQPTTFAVVKKGNVTDLERILKGKPFTLTHVKSIADKYLLKIEKT